MAILIAHRGNLNGPNPKDENHPNYITFALDKGYDVEIDVWYMDSGWWLGHCKPTYKMSLDWFEDKKLKLWIHCKNSEALEWFVKNDTRVGVSSPNYFWHQNDDYTLTSHGFVWVYPNKKLTNGCIAVMPEQAEYQPEELFNKCYAICTDKVYHYETIEKML